MGKSYSDEESDKEEMKEEKKSDDEKSEKPKETKSESSSAAAAPTGEKKSMAERLRDKIKEKLADKAKLFKSCDRWSVEESPATMVGAVLGIMMLITLIIYAIVLAIIQIESPPVETSLLESTAHKGYTMTVQCVSLSQVARDATADYSYSGGLTGNSEAAEGAESEGAFFPSEGGSGSEGEGGYGSCSYTTCSQPLNATGSTLCPDDDSQFYYECYSCGSCYVCLDSDSSCDDINWVSANSSKRDPRTITNPYKAPVNSCVITTQWSAGSKCYLKSVGSKAKNVTLALNQTMTLPICYVRAGRDQFKVQLSQTTKFWVVGTDSDFEIVGTPGDATNVLLTRVRTNNMVSNTIDDLWYGYTLSTSPNSPADTDIVITIAPIFDVVVLASAFSWVGWAGSVSGISNICASVYGIILAILLATLFHRVQDKETVAMLKEKSEMLQTANEKEEQRKSMMGGDGSKP